MSFWTSEWLTKILWNSYKWGCPYTVWKKTTMEFYHMFSSACIDNIPTFSLRGIQTGLSCYLLFLSFQALFQWKLLMDPGLHEAQILNNSKFNFLYVLYSFTRAFALMKTILSKGVNSNICSIIILQLGTLLPVAPSGHQYVLKVIHPLSSW